jgi:hypothetical protein
VDFGLTADKMKWARGLLEANLAPKVAGKRGGKHIFEWIQGFFADAQFQLAAPRPAEHLPGFSANFVAGPFAKSSHYSVSSRLECDSIHAVTAEYKKWRRNLSV